MKSLLSVIALGILTIAGVLLFPSRDKVKSVNVSSEYQPLVVVPNLQGTSGTLCKFAGTLGSVVITGAGAGTMELYDATTSNSSLRTTVATTSLTKIASIPASAAANTYTFDVRTLTGLIWEATGTKATTTLTYRCG